MSSLPLILVVVVICVGLGGMVLKKNLLMKLLNLNIVNTAVILFFVLKVHEVGDRAPIGLQSPAQYADPLPQALVLTSIVINFGVLALSLLFTMVLVKSYHTLDIEKIETMVKEEYKEDHP